jgi:hypothetical protein
LIRSTWNLARYLDRGLGAPSAAELAAATAAAAAAPADVADNDRQYIDVGTVAASVDDAIKSDFFWSFLHLVNTLNGILTHLSAWSQSCNCHSSRVKEVTWVVIVSGRRDNV